MSMMGAELKWTSGRKRLTVTLNGSEGELPDLLPLNV